MLDDEQMVSAGLGALSPPVPDGAATGARGTILHRLRRLSRHDLVAHGALVLTGATVVNVLNYVFHFGLTRRLGVVDYGTLAALLAIMAVSATPAAVLTLVVAKATAEHHATGDTAAVRLLFRTSTRVALRFGFGLLVVGVLFMRPAVAMLHVSNPWPFVLALACVAVTVTLACVRGVLQGTQEFRAYSTSLAFEAVARVALCFALAFAGYGVTGVMTGYLVAGCVAYGYSIAALRRALPASAGAGNIDVRRLLGSATGVGLTMFAITLMSYADTVVVKSSFGARDAGLYSAIALTGKIVFFIGGFLPALILPKATARAASGGDPRPLLVQAGSFTLVTSAVVLVVFGTMPALVLRGLLGAPYALAAPLVLPYGIAMAALAAATLATTYQIGLHRFGYLGPLVVVAFAEIFAISLYHPSLTALVRVIVAGHVLALCVTSFRIFRAPRPPVLVAAT